MSIFKDKPFIFISPDIGDDNLAAGAIMQTEVPNIIAKVYKWDNLDGYETCKKQNILHATVKDYMIVICFRGMLDGFPINGYANEEVIRVLEEMAKYYFESRVKPKEKGFRKCLIN